MRGIPRDNIDHGRFVMRMAAVKVWGERPGPRRWFTLLLGFALAVATFAASAEAAPPNVVVILADDLGWADLACYGNRFHETPRLDRLAAEGVRFTDFYAAAPVCSPTRAALLSGRYQARFGLTAHIPGHWRPFEQLAEPPNALALPLEVETLAERLRAAGYATAHFGKWHLGGSGFGPKAQGFDEAWEFVGHEVPGPRQQPAGTAPRRTTDYLAELGVRFIAAHRDRPFYLQLSHCAVHIPLDTTPTLEKKYRNKPRVEGFTCHPLYAGLVEELDDSVGRVLDELNRHKLAERTLVIFTSDNGGLEREVGGWPGTLNRPLREEKGTLYEGGIRAPLIARWPGVIPTGGVCRAAALTIDLAPTITEAAAAPPRDQHSFDGVDLIAQFRNAAAPLTRKTIYWHYPHYHHSRPSGAIRDGDWKLIEFFDTGKSELYNLADDLAEAHDRAAGEPARAAALGERLAAWRQSVNAQMPRRNPAYDPTRAGEWWDRGKLKPTEAPGTYRPPKDSDRAAGT